MNKYFIRAARYLAYLLIVWSIVIGLLLATGNSAVSYENLSDIAHSTNFIVLLVVVFVISLLYPKLGYLTKEVDHNIDVAKLEEELARIDIIKIKSEGNITYYRYKSAFRRFMVRYDDTFTVEFGSGKCVVEGNRVMVARAWSPLQYSILS